MWFNCKITTDFYSLAFFSKKEPSIVSTLKLKKRNMQQINMTILNLVVQNFQNWLLVMRKKGVELDGSFLSNLRIFGCENPLHRIPT